MIGEEFVHDFAEQLVGYKGGILVVGAADSADAFAAAVGVESVVCEAATMLKRHGFFRGKGKDHGKKIKFSCSSVETQCSRSPYLVLRRPAVVPPLSAQPPFWRKAS